MTSIRQDGSLCWTVHPVCASKSRSILLVAVLLLVLALVRWNYPEPIWTVLAALLLFASMARFFFPTEYRFSDEGIEVAFLGFRRKHLWKEFQSYWISPTGVLLSPFAAAHRLENFRGRFVLFGPRREEVLEYVRQHIEPAATNLGEA